MNDELKFKIIAGLTLIAIAYRLHASIKISDNTMLITSIMALSLVFCLIYLEVIL